MKRKNVYRLFSLILAANMCVTLPGIQNVIPVEAAEEESVSVQEYAPTAGDIVEAGAYDEAEVDAGVQKNDLAPDFTSVGGAFQAGNYLKYNDVDFGEAAYNTMLMSVSALAGQGGKKIGVHIDSADGTKLGTITTQECATDTEFKDCYTEISEVSGVHDLYLVFEDDAEVSMDFFVFSGYDGEDTKEEKDARMKWWRDAKYGQFIHWGAYAQLGGVYKGQSTGYAEWIMNNLGISREDYERDAAAPFNPTEFDAAKVVKLAKDAGQKYMVLTSRHHEGLSMFDTKIRDFKDYSLFSFCNNGNYQGVDPVMELSKECEKQGVKFGVYYTIMDWHDKSQYATPTQAVKDEFKTRMKGQLRELLETYHVKVLFFDGEWPGWWTKADGQEMYRYLRTLEPEVIVNNRVGKRHVDDGDYGTPEQEIPATGLDYDWESCMTLNNSWGYHKNDNSWKNADVVIDNLVNCTSKGGNYLLNIGPDEKGNVPRQSVDILEEAGTWLKKYGDSVYDTERSCFEKLPSGVLATTKENKLYLHMTKFPATGVLQIPNLKNEIKGIKVMGTDQEVSYDVIRDKMMIDLSDITEEKYDTVIELDVVGKPEPVDSMGGADVNLAEKADKVTGTNEYAAQYAAGKATDGKEDTRWATQDGTKAADLVLEYNEAITVNSCRIKNFNSPQWNNWVKAYSVDYWDGEKWVEAVTAPEMGDEAEHDFAPVTSTKFRLHIKDASNPSIWEFQLFNRETVEVNITSPAILPPATSRGEGIQISSLPMDVKGTSTGGSKVEVTLKSNNYVSEVFEAEIQEDGTWTVPVTGITESGLYSVKAVMKDENDVNLAVDSTSVYVRPNKNLAKGKKTTVSSYYSELAGFGGEAAVDGYTGTRWSPADADEAPSITVDFEEETLLNQFIIRELFDIWSTPNDYRCRKFNIEAFDGNEWNVIHEGTTIGEELTIDLEKAVKATKIRVNLLESKSNVNGKNAPANIEELEVYYTGKDETEKSTYTVTVKGGTIVESGAVSGEYDYDAAVTVKAEEGKNFAGWKVDGKVVSTEAEYTFYVSSDITLEAVYDEAVEMQAEALVTNVLTTKREDGRYDVKFVGQLVLPEGYTVEKAGLVWSSRPETELVLGKGLKPTYVARISDTNQFSVTIKGMPEGRFLRGKIFATVNDGKDSKTIYSDEKIADPEKVFE